MAGRAIAFVGEMPAAAGAAAGEDAAAALNDAGGLTGASGDRGAYDLGRCCWGERVGDVEKWRAPAPCSTSARTFRRTPSVPDDRWLAAVTSSSWLTMPLGRCGCGGERSRGCSCVLAICGSDRRVSWSEGGEVKREGPRLLLCHQCHTCHASNGLR